MVLADSWARLRRFITTDLIPQTGSEGRVNNLAHGRTMLVMDSLGSSLCNSYANTGCPGKSPCRSSVETSGQ